MQLDPTRFRFALLMVFVLNNHLQEIDAQNANPNNENILPTNKELVNSNPSANNANSMVNKVDSNQDQAKNTNNALPQNKNIAEGKINTSTGQTFQKLKNSQGNADKSSVNGEVSGGSSQLKTVDQSANEEQIQEIQKTTSNQNKNKKESGSIIKGGKVEDIKNEGTTPHPCENPDISKCFKLISNQMNKTEQLLKMANLTLAGKGGDIKDDNEEAEEESAGISEIKPTNLNNIPKLGNVSPQGTSTSLNGIQGQQGAQKVSALQSDNVGENYDLVAEMQPSALNGVQQVAGVSKTGKLQSNGDAQQTDTANVNTNGQSSASSVNSAASKPMATKSQILPVNGQQSPQILPANVQQNPQILPANAQQSPQILPANAQQSPQILPANGQQSPQILLANGQQSPQILPANAQQTSSQTKNNVVQTADQPKALPVQQEADSRDKIVPNPHEQVPVAASVGQITLTRRKREPQLPSRSDRNKPLEPDNPAPLIMFAHKYNRRVKRQFLNEKQGQTNAGTSNQNGNIPVNGQINGVGQPMENSSANNGNTQGNTNGQSNGNNMNNANNPVGGLGQNKATGQVSEKNQVMPGQNNIQTGGNNSGPTLNGTNSNNSNSATGNSQNIANNPANANTNTKESNVAIKNEPNAGTVSNTNANAATNNQQNPSPNNNNGNTPNNVVNGSNQKSAINSPLLNALVVGGTNKTSNKSLEWGSKVSDGSGLSPRGNEEKEIKELENAPNGLILVVKNAGQSNLKVGQEVDGNLNPINSTLVNNSLNKSQPISNNNGAQSFTNTNSNTKNSGNDNANANTNGNQQGNIKMDNTEGNSKGNLQAKASDIDGSNTNDKQINQPVSGQAGQANEQKQGQTSNLQGSGTPVNNQVGNANKNNNNPLPMRVEGGGEQNQQTAGNQSQNKDAVNQGNVSPNEIKNPSVMVNSVPQVQQVKQQPLQSLQEPQAAPVMEELIPEPEN